MLIKISVLFHLNQGHQITDEEIYKGIINEGKIPILTAKNKIKGYWDKSIVEDTNLPCITYPTKANSGVCYVQKSVFDANNTAVLIPKDEWRDQICLEWVAFKLSKLFLSIATSKEGVNYLNKEIIEDMEIDLPKKEIQIVQYKAISKLLYFKRIEHIRKKIERIKLSTLIADYTEYQAKDVSVKKIFNYMSGNSGLTEEYLYQTTLLDAEKRFKVLTGSIDIEKSQYTSLCPKPKSRSQKIDTFSGEGIHVVRKGKAGIINYLPKGDYTLNDDAYILFLKKNSGYDLSLKWVTIAYSNLFVEYASSSDNATWNKTSFFDHAKIDIPSKAEQEYIVKKFETIERYERVIKRIYKKINKLLEKEVV